MTTSSFIIKKKNVFVQNLFIFSAEMNVVKNQKVPQRKK